MTTATHPLQQRLDADLAQFRQDGVYKRLNYLDSPQAARVRMEGRGEVIILSSNNYLGLSAEPSVVEAGKAALDRWGAGTASVRFICGTFTVHRALESACARLVGTAASLSFVSAWNANEAVPGTLLDEQLTAARDRRVRLVVTDGIFSMEGAIAPLPDLVELCRRHDAVLMVDDSHATGVLGATGRGTAEHFGMVGEIDIITSTLGKALGGAAGGVRGGAG